MIAPVILTFVAILLLVPTLFLALRTVRNSPAARLKQRLQRMAGTERNEPVKERVSSLLPESTQAEQVIIRLPLQGPVNRLLTQSGTAMSTTLFTILNGAAFAAGFLALFVLKGNLPAAAGAGVLTALLPTLYLNHCRQQRLIKFSEQLPDALTMIARSLQAGHSLAGAVELVGQDVAEPAGGLFKIAYEQQKLGIRITETLAGLLEKIDSVDLRFFVTIIRMNSEIGGSLAEILDKLAETIRARLQVQRQVRVYTAEGKMSGYILSALPFAVFGLIYGIAPDYMAPFFTDPRCQQILGAVVLAQVVGFIVIRKIVSIRI